MAGDTPRPPQQLKTPSRFLWMSIVSSLPAELEFESRDLAILESACLLHDRIYEMEKSVTEAGVMVETNTGRRLNPCLSEIRQSRTAVVRMLAQIDMGEVVGSGNHNPSSRRAAKAAAARRWKDHDTGK